MLPEWKRLGLLGTRKKSKRKTLEDATEENLDRFNYTNIKNQHVPRPNRQWALCGKWSPCCPKSMVAISEKRF